MLYLIFSRRSLLCFAFCVVISVALPSTRKQTVQADELHWAFQQIRRPQLPAGEVESSSSNPIDLFVRQRLLQKQISPSPSALPETLVRRVTLDLLGIPPSPAEIDRFLADIRPNRYEILVSRLLASPAYGERWARPWLDLCHYADTDGYLTDQFRPVAWRYRDWVIQALNDNIPFDQFTQEQLAGDLLPEATLQQKLGTGFLRQTLSNREGGAEPEEFRVKQIVDRVEMVGTAWLALTVGCARCHDHKYDPLSQQEFFQLYACLDNADEVNVDAPLPPEQAAYNSSRATYWEARQKLVDPLRPQIEELQKRWETRCLQARAHPGRDHIWDRQWELVGLVWGGGLGEGQLEGQEIVKLPWRERTQRQKADLLDYFLRSGSLIDEEAFRELELGELRSQLGKLKREFPQATRAPVMQAALNTRTTYIHERGEFRDRGDDVVAGTPDCLPDWQHVEQDPRLGLAAWLTCSENPLTARVVVNRMWTEFFGRGLVSTTEDFGMRGALPSHPELLDWLAAEFMSTGWDIKRMHRLIVSSETYRQSSHHRRELSEVDPDNTWLARQNALRLSAEAIRDCGLAASGLLERRIGGPSVKPDQPESVAKEAFGTYGWEKSPAPDCYRRGLYTFAIRTTPFAQAVTFDAPNPNEICSRRMRSNTPLQALTLLNDSVFVEMAQALARKTVLQPANDHDRIVFAFRRCVGRLPTATEIKALQDYLAQQRTHYQQAPDAASEISGSDDSPARTIELAVWTCAASVMLNLHEFIVRH